MLRITRVGGWGNREKGNIYCHEHCFTDRHEKIFGKKKVARQQTI